MVEGSRTDRRELAADSHSHAAHRVWSFTKPFLIFATRSSPKKAVRLTSGEPATARSRTLPKHLVAVTLLADEPRSARTLRPFDCSFGGFISICFG